MTLNRENPLEILGTFASTSTIVATCAPLLQLNQVIQSKSTEKLPFHMILASFAVSCAWFLYGLLLNNLYVEVPNGIGVISAALQLSLFFIYPNKLEKTHKE
jgi:solute carrier family 50 (sugar transporter)